MFNNLTKQISTLWHWNRKHKLGWKPLYNNIWRKPDGTCCNDEGVEWGTYWQQLLPSYRYDLAIALRMYPGTDKIHASPIYPKDKLKLVEACLKSLREACGSLKVKLWVILTGDAVYEQMLQSNWPAEDLVILNVGQCGGIKSLQLQLDVLVQQTAARVVMAAEDDYFYVPGAVAQMFRDLAWLTQATEDPVFISGYDHPDNATAFMQSSQRSYVKRSDNCVWHNRATTTHTFMTSQETLQDVRNVFCKPWFSPIDADTSHWLAITKHAMFSLKTFWKLLRTSRYWAFCWAFTWLTRWHRLLFGKRCSLLIASPSLCTHMAEGLEGRGVDWKNMYGILKT